MPSDPSLKYTGQHPIDGHARCILHWPTHQSPDKSGCFIVFSKSRRCFVATGEGLGQTLPREHEGIAVLVVVGYHRVLAPAGVIDRPDERVLTFRAGGECRLGRPGVRHFAHRLIVGLGAWLERRLVSPLTPPGSPPVEAVSKS